MSATAMTTDREAAPTEDFGARMVEVLNHAALAVMVSIGHRTGLFDAMALMPAATSEEIADAAKLSERYVREWLGAMVVGGIVEHDPGRRTYRLPAEHAAWLTRAAVPNNLAGAAQWIALMGCVEEPVVAAFRHGKGVPYSSYPRFHEVMAEESEQTVVAALTEHILPLVPGLVERLSRGIAVLDVGCGSGRALLRLAEAFPRSRFRGYDFSDEAIGHARDEAGRRGLTNVEFAARDVAELSEPRAFDLITAFDAIHDQARPAEVLRGIAEALRPDGTFLMQDISGSGHLHEDVAHPFGTFLYTISCLHCMSVSLAHGGPGLGAMWGRAKALEMLREAGFDCVAVEELPHDPLNFYYIATRG
jgi:2-polyprenyl-3-methyl-5-hydroxy-6-metoxy-1,4-benzoquinol methylase